MLADIEPAKFNELLAYESLEPGDGWVQMARLEAAIINHSANPPETPVNPADLVPTRENMAKNSDEAKDAELGAKWRARLGG